jgi:hypothetical protein
MITNIIKLNMHNKLYWFIIIITIGYALFLVDILFVEDKAAALSSIKRS